MAAHLHQVISCIHGTNTSVMLMTIVLQCLNSSEKKRECFFFFPILPEFFKASKMQKL